MSCTRAWNCMRGPRLVYTCLADHLHAVFCGAFKGSATKRKNSSTPETPRPGIFLTQLFPTHPIRLLLCRHNMDRHYTEVWSFPAADAASNCGEPEVCNEWREVCFDRQTKHTWTKTFQLARSPLDSLHSPLTLHSSHIRQESPR